jgi:single-strand DNA-binding protein
MNYNKVILGGNITRDIELRYTPKGTAVCTIGIAVNRRWRDESGADREEVSFHDCQAWGKAAEVIHQYFHKGRPIFIEGRLGQDEWEDKATGQKRRKTLIVIEKFEFCGESRGGKTTAAPPPSTPKPGVGITTGRETTDEVFSSAPEGDEIPF